MGCFSKFFLFVLNFIVWGVGVAVIVLASLILAHGSEFQALLSDGTFTLPIILLILGIIVMLIGFFGCFGALRESPCLLYTYATIVLLLFIGQVGVGIYGIVEKEEIMKFVSDNMINIFNKYGRDDVELTNSLDLAQNNLHCCGVFNYTDWYSGVINANIPPGDVPMGCCKVASANCNVGIGTKPLDEIPALIYTEGCYTLFVETLQAEALWLIIGAIVLGLVQLACVVIACGIGKQGSSQHVY